MIRCRQCDHPNPEDHRFCGMCGSRLAPVASSIALDDDDPLELENSARQFESRSHHVAQIRGNQQREAVRERISRNGGDRDRSSHSLTAVDSAPGEADQEPLRSRPAPASASGIGGPSFLGLNYESPNSGFVYDDPNGFIYDTDSKQPEYLLEEIPRGVSWRAWALFLLLLVGAGLGYIQWRASHHQGPDLASILARNGPTVDPGGPVMPDKNAKPADNKSENKDASADSADSDANADENAQPASAKSDTEGDSASAQAAAGSTKNVRASDQNSAKTKAADRKEDSSETDSEQPTSAAPSEAKGASAASKPESDGPRANSAKAARSRPVLEQEPAAPKSLGDKDPLLLQADKYVNGRGVPKNCSRGVNLLREAVSAGNPSASVKLGALYWSGNCVTQSKVTAYEWFSRAHSMQPKNRWIERSRNSLWASMSPAEQRRVSY